VIIKSSVSVNSRGAAPWYRRGPQRHCRRLSLARSVRWRSVYRQRRGRADGQPKSRRRRGPCVSRGDRLHPTRSGAGSG
jgi:hypothetical protein